MNEHTPHLFHVPAAAVRLALPLAAALAAGALGCGVPDLAARLESYHAAIDQIAARPSGVDARGAAAAPRLPDRRDRRIEIPDHRVGGFDFLAIQGCRLGALVGSRNGPMGRVMVPSRRLIYEVAVIEAADECLEDLDAERAARLRAVLDEKSAELPAHIWNALWMGEEMEAYLSSMPRPLATVASLDERSGLEAVVLAMRRPMRRPEDAEALEAALVRMRDEYPAGATLRALDRARHYLDEVAALVEGRDATSCRGDEVRLATAFKTHYLPVQATLAALDRRALARLESLDALFSVSSAGLAAPPAAMAAYHRLQLDPEAPQGAWRRYRGAVLRHASAWERTLTLCGVLPGSEKT